MMTWMQQPSMTIVGLILWAIGILWLMPGKKAGKPRPHMIGVLIVALGLVTFCLSCGKAQSEFADDVMFWVFAIGALISGVLMITARNPVYAALWFALATLSTCGLFLLQHAPFLAAATIIVYAGAVIVTFLFVIMLAQQSGAAGYDQRSSQSLLATISAFVLLGAISLTLQSEKIDIVRPVVAADNSSRESSAATGNRGGAMIADLPSADIVPVLPGNVMSKADAKHAVGNLKGLGKSLFSDYLFAVELAGTLLLVASIGAIAIAPRREQGAI
ncbi:MAG: NADH-quinone oxidoreductase subunit J [Fuerstia sp.]|nr:NADH-quinone oxidoreductase subunit J [Fuerstiella sp.]